MSTIEANININIPDGVDAQQIISLLQHIVSNLNNKNTHVNVIEVDDPLSLSPLTMKKLEE